MVKHGAMERDRKIRRKQAPKHVDQNRVSRMLERLRETISDYDFDASFPPFHSSYDNWHFLGKEKPRRGRKAPPQQQQHLATSRPASARTLSDYESTDGETSSTASKEDEHYVIARVSKHALRLEREFKQAQVLQQNSSKEDRRYFVQPLRFYRLPIRQPGDKVLAVSIVEAPGRNYLHDIVEYGPNFYSAGHTPRGHASTDSIELLTFLDFAIGATKCCELLHHGHELVHGEIRGDAFHYNRDTQTVRLINFGSGARSFENGLTSAGWSSLTAERGVEHKLQFIAPEQTGRLPAEPDTRTDLYSLGVLLWTMLTKRPPFKGDSPLEIMASVLSKRIPLAHTIRPDVPEALSLILQKMTQRSIDDRYHSASGVKHDFVELKRILTEGDTEALEKFKVGSHDVSCFFKLPQHHVGREEQRATVMDVIERAARRAAKLAVLGRNKLSNVASGVSIISSDRERTDSYDDTLSTSTSSGGRDQGDGRELRLNSVPELVAMEALQLVPTRSVHSSNTSVAAQDTSPKALVEVVSNAESKLSMHSSGDSGAQLPSSVMISGSDSASVFRTAAKLKYRGRTEIIAICGGAGFGKTTLIQSVQGTARRHGYYTSAKFNSVSKVPFEPLLKVMSSLFRQIFSEHNVNTPLHDNIRQFVKPVWPMLHTYLELPAWLLSPGGVPKSQSPGEELQQDFATTSSGSSNSVGTKKKGMCDAAATHEWLRSGGSSKSSRFIYIFTDVLRLLAFQKFICFCLDDLQFADVESLDLLYNIVSQRIPVVLIATYRADDLLSPATRTLLERATVVNLGPFTESETAQYVADTLLRNVEYCMPLSAVIQEKTSGNPFFVREMLDSAYRKKCIFYCWRCSHWEFSLEKIFDEFASPDVGRFSSNDFIVRRLLSLPQEAISLLSWASMLGDVFPYKMIQYVMSCDCSKTVPQALIPPTHQDSVHGLQVALTSYFIMPTESDNEFRFSHDRYLTACDSLCDGYDRSEMHYVMAGAFLKHAPYDPATQPEKVLFDQARHVCAAVEVIKKRLTKRAHFRDLLYQAADAAKDSGARKIALVYYQQCLALLPDHPWSETQDDVSYPECLALHTKAADAYWFQGNEVEATKLLDEITKFGRDPISTAPASIIRGRILEQRGQNQQAFLSLTVALSDLGIEVPDWTWEEADARFEEVMTAIEATNPDIEHIANTWKMNHDLNTVGAVLTELLSASFWTDTRLFYCGTIVMSQLYIMKGVFPQIALGFLYAATISIYRFNNMERGLRLADLATRTAAAFDQEHYMVGRTLTLHPLFVGHLVQPVQASFAQLDKALEATIACGDKLLQLLTLGINGAYRVWASEDMSEIEQYANSISEELPDWKQSVRGGAMLVAVKQYSRALQGKTNTGDPGLIMSDDEHSTSDYLGYLSSRNSLPARSQSIYQTFMMDLLFRYGYYKEAFAIVDERGMISDELWCSKFTYSFLFYASLSILAILREEPLREDRNALLDRLAAFRARIEIVASINAVNYAHLLMLIDAGNLEQSNRGAEALALYEKAIDHATLHSFVLDEALGLEMYADFLIRKGAKRSVRGLVLDCVSAYRRITASGKATQVTRKYGFLLYGTRGIITRDMATQTDMIDTGNTPYKLEQNNTAHGPQTPAERTQEWLDPAQNALELTTTHKEKDESQQTTNLSAVGLDMIDLASILESSQLMSSELDVERLLSRMTRVIVDSTGAELTGLSVEADGGGWLVAATGTSEGITPPPFGMDLEEVADPVAKQVTLYALRFKEMVFLRNVLDDERFANVPATWLKERPEGRSMLAMPILHGDDVLLGSVYCEAPPNTFTERTVTLLRLLVNQVAISIANALLFKRVEKVCASNQSMVEVQKQALAQAREAEKKAKEAEANAMEMVRLKDEAARAKSMFLANVSHELRTPLNGVLGMSELLKATTISKDQEEHIDSIRLCADTLLSIINSILDYSKLEAGKLALSIVPLNPSETISEVVRALSYANMERDLRTIIDLKLAPDLVVLGDPVRIHQVCFNIMSNSYKFTQDGSVTVRAVTDSEDEDNIQITISVQDTGIGVTEEQQKKLFLPFSQADASTARSYGGTGLGLSICKAIVENVMHGRIWMDSAPGVGTTVSFSLPFKKVNDANRAELASLARTQPDPMSLYVPAAGDATSDRPIRSLAGIPREKIRVCIAEDNPINSKIAVSFVKKLGFICEAFENGKEAYDALDRAVQDENPFHLVLMDVQMPILDGYDATRQIRKHPDARVRDVLVIAMTASAIRGDREKCLEAGMNSYLAKPVRADTLKLVLEGFLKQADKTVPDLQKKVVEIFEDTTTATTTGKMGQTENRAPKDVGDVKASSKAERPKSIRKTTTEIHLRPEEMRPSGSKK